MPTRNRVELFTDALNSVAEQSYPHVEIIVVNDGSTIENRERYAELISSYPVAIRYEELIEREKGHGQSYSINHGVSLAKGDFVTFLDDDDYWTDNDYLSKAADYLQQNSSTDLMFSNQKAFFHDGTEKQELVWVEELAKKPAHQAIAPVELAELLSCVGFAHLNCTLVKRELFNQISGMDENIRYECDRDFYYRIADAAKSIAYNPDFISRHNIPDQSKADNMSTLVNDIEKRLYQVTVFNKNLLLAEDKDLVAKCADGLQFQFKHIAHLLYQQKNYALAAKYAKQAMSLKFNFKWLGFVVMVQLRALTQ